MASTNFDPIKAGATSFDPSQNGATPSGGGIMDTIKNLMQGAGNIAPAVGGIGGAMMGGVAGSGGGAFGGAAGAAIGEDIRSKIRAMTGQSAENIGQQALRTGGSALEYGALGALPTFGGSAFSKLPFVPRVAAKVAARGIGGALVGGVSQVGQNIASGKPLDQNVGQSAGATAAINEIIPGIFDTIGLAKNLAGKTSGYLSRQSASSQVGYGLSDSEAVKPFVNSDPQVTHDQLVQGMTDKWKSDIAPTLQNNTASVDDFIKTIQDSSITVPPGYTGTKAQYLNDITTWVRDQAGADVVYGDSGLPTLEMNKIPLDKLNAIKSALGEKLGYDTPVYHAAQNFINDSVSKVDSTLADKMYQYGQLRQATDAVAKVLEKQGMPGIKTGSMIEAELMGGAAGMFGGIPGMVTMAGLAGTGLSAARNPGFSAGLAKGLQNFSQNPALSPEVAKALTQLLGGGAMNFMNAGQ